MTIPFFKLVILLSLFVSVTFAQSGDSLIVAEGKVINAATKELVIAKITYQSLPYGNRLGIITNNSFSFPMFDGEKYSIVVEAPGFTVAKYLLDPAEANGDKKVIKDIELTVEEVKTHSVGQLMRLNDLIFQVGKAKVSPESYDEIDIIVKMMK